ncbi:unnamed protein product [Sphagnum troendelagicum]|uniref:Uncharacterized protein n=1 Tax=Sphagnum troendelagicum TaxID=128251 RepID=A0ABP0TT03_9BRYO
MVPFCMCSPLSSLPPAGSFSYGHHVPQGRQSHHSFTRVEAAAGAAPAASQQWNARIAKTNRKSRFRDALSTVDFEEETIAPLPDLVAPQAGFLRPKKLSLNDWEEQAYQIILRQKLRNASPRGKEAQNLFVEPHVLDMRASTYKQFEPYGIPPPEQVLLIKGISLEDAVFQRLARELGLERKWQPLMEYLTTLGICEGDFQRIADRHKACLQANVTAVQERVEFLVSLGVKREHLRKLIVRHPQIIEYTVERAVKPRIQYLKSLGLPENAFGRVITVAPSLLECSLQRSLKPRVRYLVDTVGVKEADMGLIITRSPQVLTQSIEDSLEPRVEFFTKKMGVSKERLAKMVTRHPQLLHYSVQDGIRPRVNYLRSIGMTKADVGKVLSRLTQVLSLSVENCLKPKYDYLVKELKGNVDMVTSFPAYFSLSLEQRIKPRHQFLVAMNRMPSGPFPMKCLAVTDACFCEQWAKSSLEEYYAFRNDLLLSNFAKKFESKNKVHI